MLRMKTYVCMVCMKEWEEIAHPDDQIPQHCGQIVRLKILAPSIRYLKPHFNYGLGKKIKSYEHLERELKTASSFIPTGNDLSAAMNYSIEDEQAAASRARKPRIREVAERVWSDLHNENKA